MISPAFIIGFLVVGFSASAIFLRVTVLRDAMASAVSAIDAEFKARHQTRWFARGHAAGIPAEYRRHFPDGPLTAKLRRGYWAIGIWAVLALCWLLAFAPR